MELLTNILVTALFIFGVNAVTRENKILRHIGMLANFNGDKSYMLANVVSECPTCMASLYGLIGYFYLNNITIDFNITLYVPCMLVGLFVVVDMTLTHMITLGFRKVFLEVRYGVRVFEVAYYFYTLFLIVSITKQYRAVIFIIMVSGLCSLLESGLLASKKLGRLNENVSDLLDTYINVNSND